MRFRCRDFVVTGDGLVFAVSAYCHPKGRVIGFLRFISHGGGWKKLGTTFDSYQFLRKNHPEYLFQSKVADAILQAIPIDNIEEVVKPDEFLLNLKPGDGFKGKVVGLTHLLSKYSGVPLGKFGVTGSVLVGAHTLDSDIDVVVYGLDDFNTVRRSLPGLLEAGLTSELNAAGWEQWYDKRLPGCELSLEEFMWHERRKNNYGVCKGTKFDVLYAREWGEISGSYGDVGYKKLSKAKIKAKVTDDTLAFDCPAAYKVKPTEGKPVKEIVSYTHTYAGQAFKGETIEASGILEEVHSKKETYLRLLVGSTREAEGEYIKVAP